MRFVGLTPSPLCRLVRTLLATAARISVVLLGFTLLCPSARATADNATFSIDMKTLRWTGKVGFVAEDAKGLTQAQDLPAGTFPLSPNKLFEVPADGRVHHFGLQTRFSLTDVQRGGPALAMALGQIGEAFEIYLNGHLVVDELEIDDDGALTKHLIARKYVVELPQALLLTGENLLVFHLAGHAPTAELPFVHNRYLQLGTKRGTRIAPLRALSADRVDAFNLGLGVTYAFFSLFFAYLFARRREAVAWGWFAAFLAVMFWLTLSLSPLLYSGVRETEWIFRMVRVGVCAMPFLLFAVLHAHFYPDRAWGYALKYFAALGLLGALAALALPFRYLDVCLIAVEYLTFPVMPVYTVVFAVRILRERLPQARAVAVGLLIVVASSVATFTDELFLQTGVFLIQYGATAFIMILTGMMMARLVSSRSPLVSVPSR